MTVDRDNYKQAGVDVKAGDEFSARLASMQKATYDNCRYVDVVDLSRGLFRGPRPCFFKDIPFPFGVECAPDGVGTKTIIHDAIKKHRLAAHDLLAMTMMDITRFGGLTCVFHNVLDIRGFDGVDSETFNLYLEMFEELVEVATRHNVVVHKGETAELNDCVSSSNIHCLAPFNWSGFALGIYDRDRIIIGENVMVGDVVIALREHGPRSNGISLIRRALEAHYGADFYVAPVAQEALNEAAIPSALYDNLLTTANGWYEPDFKPLIDVSLIAHLSGGGIGKFVELLAPGELSAELEDLYELPPIMYKCADWQGLSDREIYTTWNGGQGALVVVPASQEDDFLDMAAGYGIEAKTCGKIVESDEQGTKVTLVSKMSGRTEEFTPEKHG